MSDSLKGVGVPRFIVGGIVVMFAGVESIPVEWLEHREQMPSWGSSF